MSTESALLLAIRANPDEDTPRLVYADWLDEHADVLPGRAPAEVRARAEFIRLQIAFAGRDDDPDFADARGRADALRSRYGAAWVKWDPPTDARDFWYAPRGFPERNVDIAMLPSIPDDDFARAPVGVLHGCPTPYMAERFATCSHLQRVRRLELSGYVELTRGDLERVFNSPYITGLRELLIAWFGNFATMITEVVAGSEQLAGLESFEFRQHQFTPGAARALAGSQTIRLRRLVAGSSDCGDESLSALAGSPAVSRLERLSLWACQLSAAGALALAESPHLGPLWYLQLGWNRIGPAGVTALARSPRLKGLRVLGLSGTGVGPKGLAELSRSEHLRALGRLELRSNQLRTAGPIIAEGPAFAHLRALQLDENNIGDAGPAALARSAVLNGLERLELRECGIKEGGAKALADGAGLRALTHLELGHNRVGAVGTQALAAEVRFPCLRVLSLSNNFVGDTGARALARSPQMETVEELNLHSNKIGDVGAKALLDSPHLTNLKRLDLSHNKMSRAVKTAIEKRFAQPSE